MRVQPIVLCLHPACTQLAREQIDSRRFVPLHPSVVRAGFLDYVAWIVETYGHGPLFPMLSAGKRGMLQVIMKSPLDLFKRGNGELQAIQSVQRAVL